MHDRFALPCFLRQDLQAVIGYLNEQGFSFAADGFDAQLDFRFPLITAFTTGDVQWTLRQALEPWPVMGEHEGTGRVVDSTTDRLELLAGGMTDRSCLVASVNGIRVPLLDTGQGGCRRHSLPAVRQSLGPATAHQGALAADVADQSTRAPTRWFMRWTTATGSLGGGNYDLAGSEEEARRAGRRTGDRAAGIGRQCCRTRRPACFAACTLHARPAPEPSGI